MAPSSKRQRRSSTASATSNDNVKEDGAASTLPSGVSSATPNDNVQGNGAASTLPSLQNFALLPNELRTRIVKLACRLPASSPLDADESSTTSSSATPGLDTATAVNLVRVSRSLYAVVTPLIWSHVWITTASALASFHHAIAAGPQLGRLVVNLHIGPDDQLPEWWYPLHPRAMLRPVVTTISHSLRSAQEAQLLPLWCDKDEDWTLTDTPADDCRDLAIHLALQALQRSLDIDLTDPGCTMNAEQISIQEWTTRVYELRAGLELYLMAMRQIDDQHQRSSSRKARTCGGHDSRCFSYPPLLLTGASSACAPPGKPSETAAPPITLSRHQLLRHLARPGSITDRLDHPLTFERSGIAMTHGVDRYGNERFSDGESKGCKVDDIADRFAPSHAGTAHSAVLPATPEVLDPSLHSTVTLGSLLALARSVISFTPLLRNLSLTGLFDRAVLGIKRVSLPSLQHLSIGPPPAAWFAPLSFENIETIESLRICGVELGDSEALDIVYDCQSLKHLQLSLGTQWSTEPEDSPSYTFLEELFDTLKRGPTLRAPLPSIDNNHGAGLDDESDPMSSILAKTKRLEEMEIELQKAREIVLRGEADHASPESSPEEGTAPLYEIRIHPTDLKSLLEKAPTPEIRAAWTNGQVVDAKDHCRLLLVESAAAAKGAWRGVSCTSSEELFKEGTEWWERCAGI